MLPLWGAAWGVLVVCSLVVMAAGARASRANVLRGHDQVSKALDVEASTLKRCRLAAVAVVCTAVMIAVQASSSRGDPAPVTVQNSGDSRPLMTVQGTASDDQVTATIADGEWVIESPNGTTGYGCQADSATRVHCTYHGRNFTAALFEGNDTVDLNGSRLRGKVNGGPGNDTLLGNSQHNYFEGGPGNDVIKAGAGPDVIHAEKGHDSIFGQRGSDRIYADGGVRDRRIDCGPGKNDLAVIDRNLDPHPIGCETIRYGS